MFVHFHNREDCQCDGCRRRTIIVDLLSTQSGCDLRLLFPRTCGVFFSRRGKTAAGDRGTDITRMYRLAMKGRVG
jgi:hypothetical protein